MDFYDYVSTKQRRIAELARIHPELSFTSLAHHLDLKWLYEAYRRTRKSGATGIDEQTAQEYHQDIGKNLRSLLERVKAGTYKAPPVKRAYIPKGSGTGELRPIGIPTFEDKVLQRAIQMLIEPILEHDFLDYSYGFRPGKSAHMAIEALWKKTMDAKGGWIIDLDIRKFFDTLDHKQLREILKKRVCDGVVIKLINKWLKAGVLEDGTVKRSKEGTPQGGVISPILSNIYLHEVLDKWYEDVVKPRLKGQSHLVRYADDAVLVFSNEEDANRVMKVIGKRFEKYGLKLHPEKTKLICFTRPSFGGKSEKGKSFNFLGFTHYWGKSKKGGWTVKRKTEKGRLRRALRSISEWCKKNRHWELKEQHEILKQKVNGHYAYYGITGNKTSLAKFKNEVERIWQNWLNRRSRNQDMPWKRFHERLKVFPLPPVRIVHSYCTAKL